MRWLTQTGYKPEEIVDGDLAEWIGAVYALLGEKEPALACLRQAVRRGNHNYPWYRRDKNWDKLRGDPAFRRIMSEVQGYWKHYPSCLDRFSPDQILIERKSLASRFSALRHPWSSDDYLTQIPETVLDPRAWQRPSRYTRLRHGHAVGLRLAQTL